MQKKQKMQEMKHSDLTSKYSLFCVHPVQCLYCEGFEECEYRYEIGDKDVLIYEKVCNYRAGIHST